MANKRTLVGVVGFLAAGLLTATVHTWEGRELKAYRDIAGYWTICDGDTSDVRPDQIATHTECDGRLEQQLIAHAEPVLACVPELAGRPYQLAASVSLAYNIGPGAFCKSTLASHFRAGRWREGCDGFLAWRYAGGEEVRGLLNRRREERALCLRGL